MIRARAATTGIKIYEIFGEDWMFLDEQRVLLINEPESMANKEFFGISMTQRHF